MLRELLLRDLGHHRRVLAGAAMLPLVLLASMALPAGPGGPVHSGPIQARPDLGVLHLVFGLMLLCVLPLSLHLREGVLGTLGDLLALPVSRRELVRLRFLEGFLVCAAFTLLHLLRWLLLGQSAGAWLSELFRSPALLWLPVLFMAYPLPFTLRWGGKGLGLALGGFVGGFFLWALLMVFGHGVPLLGPALKALLAGLDWLLAGMGFLPPALVACAIPLLLLVLFYRLAILAFAGKDA